MKRLLPALCLLLCLASPSWAATYLRPLTASFGSTYTGKAANLTYRVIDTAGTTLIAATGTGITESPSGSGIYYVNATWDTTWGSARVEWLDATDSIYASAPVAPAIGVQGNTLTVGGLAPPTNWNLASIDGSGRVLLQPTQTGVTIPTVTTVGSVSGAVASVTGSVGSVTGSVGSVTGAVGSVTGAVGSVTGGVTVTTNNDKTGYTASTVSDKTGYSLSASGLTGTAYAAAPTAAQVRTEMDANSTKLANLDAAVSSRSTYAGADTAGTTTLLSRVPTFPANFSALSIAAGTGYVTATNGGGGGSDPWATALPGSYGAGTAGYLLGHNLDTQLSLVAAATVTAMKADSLLAKTFNRTRGKYTYVPSTHVMTLLDDSGSSIGTVTLTIDATTGQITARQ